MNNYTYDRTHRLRFTVGGSTYDSYSTWTLVPASKPSVSAPDDNVTQIPLKYSETAKNVVNGISATGEMSGKVKFVMKGSSPDSTYASIKSALHCKFGTMTFLDSGRTVYAAFFVGEYKADKLYSTIVIEYKAVDAQDTPDSLTIVIQGSGSSSSYNTLTNWHMIPVKRAVLAAPADDAKYITINYPDGSERRLCVGSAPKGARTGSIDFIVVSATPDSVHSSIISLVHGKPAQVSFSTGGSGRGKVMVSSYDTSDKFPVLRFDYELYDTNTGDIKTDELTPALAHAVTFTVNSVAKNTWTDFDMISEEVIAVAAPSVKTNYVSVPGLNGSLDLSEALTNHPLYDNVKGSMTFTVTGASPVTTYYNVMRYLHGMRGSMSPLDGGSFTGRFSVDGYSVSDGIFRMTIGYILEPYITRS
jgi:hypothetical protein